MTLAPLKVPGLERIDPLAPIRDEQEELRRFEQRRGRIAPAAPQPDPQQINRGAARLTGKITPRLASVLPSSGAASTPPAPAAQAPAAPRNAWLEGTRPTSEKYGAKYKIPPEVLLGINASETNWGNAGSWFGRKGSGTAGSDTYDTWEMVDGKRVNVRDQFAKFNNADEAYADFFDLVSKGRYAKSWQYLQETGDWRGWLDGLNKAGYATDPNWSKMIAGLAENISQGRIPSGSAGRDIDSWESPTTEAAGRSTVSGRKFTSRLLEVYEPDEGLRRRIEPYVNALAPELAEGYLAKYRATKRTVSPNAALQELYRSLQIEAIADVMAPFIKERRPGQTTTHEQDLTAAAALLERTGSLEGAMKALNIQKETLESANTFGAIFLQAAMSAGLGAAFAPVRGAQAAGRVGTIARILGPGGTGPGRFALENVVQEAAAQAAANEVGKRTGSAELAFGAGILGSAAATKATTSLLGRRGMIARAPVANIIEPEEPKKLLATAKRTLIPRTPDEMLTREQTALKRTSPTPPPLTSGDEGAMQAFSRQSRNMETTPPEFPNYPTGVFRRGSEWEDGRVEVEQLQEYSLDDPILEVFERGFDKDQGVIDKYAGWMSQPGQEPPPLSAVEVLNDDGTVKAIRVNDGAHRVKALEQARGPHAKVKVWVALTDPDAPARPLYVYGEPKAAPLPQDHAARFNVTEDSIEIPLEKLRPSKPPSTQPASVDEAARRWNAGGKRAPIDVRAEADGTYTIIDGNASYGVAERSGWATMPARVVESAGESPNAARSSGVAGLAANESETGGPGLTQRSPSQASEITLPDSRTSLNNEPSSISGVPSAPATKPILQQVDDLDTLFEIATAKQPTLVNALVDDFGDNFIGARVKEDGPRIREKLANRSPAQISDYLGARVLATDPDAAVAIINSKFPIIQGGDMHINLPDSGYRARHLQVDVGDGLTAEVQVLEPKIAAVQDWAHTYYEAMRSPEVDADLFDRASAASRYLFGHAPDVETDVAKASAKAFRDTHDITKAPAPLREVLTQAERIFRGAAPNVDLPPREAPGQVIARLPDVNGVQRDRRVISVADVTTREDLFQARDTSPGKPYNEERVQAIVRDWDDALFIPPNVVRDPDTGKYIVYSGHHRSEAWRRVKGADAPMEAVFDAGDIKDPADLARLQFEADTQNFTTRTPNFRETIRVVNRGLGLGNSLEEIAGRIDKTPSYVEKMLDAARVGDAAVDRVVTEKGLEPYLAEIGRGMRLHGMTLEEANGFFNQIADAKKGQRPTVAAVRQTIDEDLAAYRQMIAEQAQQPMFGAEETARMAGTEAGFMGFMADIARTRGELEGEIKAVHTAQNAAEKLGDMGNTPSARQAAQRLVNIGKAEERRIRQLLELQQVNIRRLARGEAPLPAPGTRAAETPVTRNERLIATAQGMDDNESVQAARRILEGQGIDWRNAPTSAPAAVGGQPPAAPPRTPVDDSSLDGAKSQLVAYVEAAGAMRPDLLERRRLELRSRVARAATDLHAEGVAPDEAFAYARRQLRGQLADPAFEMPGSLDADVLHREIIAAVDRNDVPFFTGNAADRGLQKLKMGQIPAPNEVEALGQVFGPRLQFAIEGLGDIFKVQRRIQTVVERVDVEIKFPDGGVLTPDDLADAMAAHIPNADPDTLRKASERLIDAGKVGVAIDPKTGKTTARVNKTSEVDALGEAAYQAMFDEPVPGQDLPPTSPKMEDSFQPSLALAQKNEGPPAPIGDTAIESPQMQAQRAQLEADYLARTGKVRGDDWDPSAETLTARIFGSIRNVVGLPRVLMATMDRSSYLRQGGLLIRHGEQVLDGISKTMVIAENAEDAARLRQRLGLPDDWEIPNAEDVMGALHNDRWATARKTAGVYEEAWGPNAKLSQRNEQFMSDLAERIIPGAKMSNRAHVVYLNKLRADVFNSVVDKWVREGRKFGNKDLKALAQYVNAATGRGNLRDFEGAAAALATTFFAPRYLVSRFEVLGQLLGPSTPYLVRKEMAKDLAVFVGTGMSLLSVAKLSGLAEVEDDPRSSDFGKMKIGHTRVDLFGGYTQIARYTAQLMTGQAKSATGNMYDVNRGELVLRYLRSKLAPSTGFGVSTLFDEDMTGKPFDPLDPSNLTNMLVPLFIQDLYKAVDEQGAAGLLYFPAGFFGAGVQTYTTPSEQLREARNAESQRRYGVDFEDLPDRYPSQGFSRQAEIDQTPGVAKKKEASREASRQMGYGQEQVAREESKAEYTARRQQAEQAFRDGTLSKPLPEVWSDISKEEAGARRAFEIVYGDADFDKTAFDKALNGYYDKTVTGEDGQIDWEQTILAQDQYLRRLPSKERQQIEDFLGVQDRKKSQAWQDYRAFVDAKEKAGYYREGITNAERLQLDRENPELDVQGWYWRGGVKPDKGPTPSLQSAAAVDRALELINEKGVRNRLVKLDGLDRVINADEGTIAAWRQYGARIENFTTKAIVKYGDREALRLYKKPFAELSRTQQSSVISRIHAGLRESSAELDAVLAWFGYGADQDKTYALRSRAAGRLLQAIKARYGDAAPREGYRFRYTQDVR